MRTARDRDAYERRRIERISESDFWGAWSIRNAAVREAARLGQAGRRAAAYARLAEYHRESLAGEWEWVRQDALERNREPEARQRMLVAADDVRAGRIRGWISQVIHFGRHIDFNANFGESGQYGFHYLYWLVPLVDRYLLDGDKADLRRIVEIVRQYYDQRTGIRRRIPRLHPVYYELGAWAKTCNLLPAYLALIRSGSASSRDIEAFLKLFLGFGRSLYCLQGSGYRAGNWQIVGCQGLFRLGALFPDLREAARWRARATEIMEAHLEQDFYRDGGHKERCWSYGWMSLKGVLMFYEAGARTGFLPAGSRGEILRSIRRAFRWFHETLTPTQIMPAYGDGDLVRADDLLAKAEGYLPESATRGEHGGRSIFLRPSGYAVMRDPASKAGLYLNVNFGEWGGGHTHQDLLDFNVWAFGEPVIEEVGRFDSYDQPLNPFFRSPEAHNQIVLDHQAMDRRSATGRGVVWRQTPDTDYFGAWHDAYGLARIQRHILFKRGEYWVIYDLIEPRKETIFTVSSYLHSPRPFRLMGPGVARVTGRAGCVVAFAHPAELKRLETGVDIAASEVTADRLYPERHHLRARLWAPIGYRGYLRLVTLLYPFKGQAPRVGIAPVRAARAELGVSETFEVFTPRGRDRIRFDRGSRPALALT